MKLKVTQVEREAILNEALKREGLLGRGARQVSVPTSKEEAFLSRLHPKQLEFVNSPAKRKIAVCGRRAGKTTALLYMVMRAIRSHENVTLPYICLSREQGRKLFWRPLKELNQEFGLGLEFNEQRLAARAPNGTEIIIIGAGDSDEVEKLRGDRFPLVLVDESGSFKPHIELMVEDIIEPALLDFDGELVMTGTPGMVPAGFFFEAALGIRKGWERFHWTVLDNPYVPAWRGKPDWAKLAAKHLEQQATKFGASSAKFRREWLGEYVADEDGQYYKFGAERNVYTPPLPGHDWNYVLGIDFGYEDPTAIVVIAVSPYSENTYVVETFSKAKMVDLEVVAKLKEFEARYHPIKRVADFAAKQFVVTLNTRYSLGLVAANKGERLGQIDLLNSDFLTGRLLVNTAEKSFQDELLTTAWNHEHTGPAATRHLGHHADRLDALRYAWVAARPWSGKLVGEEAPIRVGSPADQEMQDYLEKAMNEAQARAQEGKISIEEYLEDFVLS